MRRRRDAAERGQAIALTQVLFFGAELREQERVLADGGAVAEAQRALLHLQAVQERAVAAAEIFQLERPVRLAEQARVFG